MTQILKQKQVILFVMQKMIIICFSVGNELSHFTFQMVNTSHNCPEKRCFSGHFYFALPINEKT